MAWCGDSLCLGIKREYVMMNISTGASFDVFPCGRIAAPLAIPLPNGEILLGKVCLSFSQAKNVWVISPYRNLHWWKERHMWWIMLSCMWCFGWPEVAYLSLILQDNIGVVVDHNGKLSHSGEGNLSWSEAPSCVVIQPPYALARLSRFIEVSVFPLSTSCLTEISCLRVTHETISLSTFTVCNFV